MKRHGERSSYGKLLLVAFAAALTACEITGSLPIQETKKKESSGSLGSSLPETAGRTTTRAAERPAAPNCKLPALVDDAAVSDGTALLGALEKEAETVHKCPDHDQRETAQAFLKSDAQGPKLTDAALEKALDAITRSPTSDPEDLLVAFRRLYFLATEPKSGIGLAPAQGVELALSLLEKEGLLNVTAGFITGFKYAHAPANQGGLELPSADAAKFARQIVKFPDPLRAIKDHRRAFKYAMTPPRGEKPSLENARKVADQKIDLKADDDEESKPAETEVQKRQPAP